MRCHQTRPFARTHYADDVNNCCLITITFQWAQWENVNVMLKYCIKRQCHTLLTSRILTRKFTHCYCTATQLSVCSYWGHRWAPRYDIWNISAIVTRCLLPGPGTSIDGGNCVCKTQNRRNKIVQKRWEKSPGSATITSRSLSQTPRGRGNRQNQTNRTKVQKALRLALSSRSEVIGMLKGLKTQ